MTGGRRRVPVVPWTWGHGPRPREVPLPVVFRAIRSGDLDELEGAYAAEGGRAGGRRHPGTRPPSATRRRSGAGAVAVAARVLLGCLAVVAGLALVVLLVLLGGA